MPYSKVVEPAQGIGRIIVGDFVHAMPHTDSWMRGDRNGTVVTIGYKWVTVRMARSGSLRRFAITPADEGFTVPGLEV